MPVSFSCSCGKQLRVPDEYAGRRVKCPGCGEATTVPTNGAAAAPKRAPAPQAPPAGMIRFACECGKQMQARAEYAGRTTQCPACGAEVVIPGEEAEEREGARIQSDRPSRRAAVGRGRQDDYEEELEEAPRKKRRDDDYDDRAEDEPRKKKRRRDEEEEDPYYEDEDRPRKGKKKKKAGALPWILAACAAVLVLGGGAFGAWYFFFSGDNVSEKALIPSDAQAFVTVRVADVWKTSQGQKLAGLAKAQGGKDLVQEMEKNTSLKPEDIERATLVVHEVPADLKQEPTKVWVVIRTVKKLDRKAILAKLQSPRKVKHEKGKTYHVGKPPSSASGKMPTPPALPPPPGGGKMPPGMMPPGGMPGGAPVKSDEVAVYFAGSKVLVFAPEAGMKACLDALARKSVTGPLAGTIDQALGGNRHFVLGFNLSAQQTAQIKALGAMAGGGMGGPGAPPNMGGGFKDALEITGGSIILDVGDTIPLEVVLRYPDEAKAKKTRSLIDAGKVAVEGFYLPMLEQQLKKGPMGPEKGAALYQKIKTMFESISTDQSGNEVQVKIKIDTTAFEGINPGMFMGGMPGMPGPGGKPGGIRPGPKRR
jgi:hypothetical protein